MRTSALLNLVILLFTTNVTAQLLYQNQSSLFSLVIVSNNTTLNGTTLWPCHEGALLEGLCIANDPPTPASPSTAFFNFNTTGDGTSGILSYTLDLSNGNVTSPMSLGMSPISNIAMPMLEPGNVPTNVAFDCEGRMYIQGSTDDTVYPQAYKITAYYRWYACITDELSYTYQTLAWVIGPGKPENPTCQKVDVLRV